MDNLKGSLFVGSAGLFKMYCDFLVICICDIEDFTQGELLTVTDVKTSSTGRIVYEINGALYYHSYFALYDGHKTNVMKNTLAEIQISYSCNIPKEDRMQIRSSGDAYAILTGYWNMDLMELQEEFNIIILNRANEVLGIYNISKGGSTGTVVDAKLVFATALKCNANSIVLAHNHPSGNLTPSQNDLNLTRKLKKAGEVLDISVVDHLILTKDGYYSFADEGIL